MSALIEYVFGLSTKKLDQLEKAEGEQPADQLQQKRFWKRAYFLRGLFVLAFSGLALIVGHLGWFADEIKVPMLFYNLGFAALGSLGLVSMTWFGRRYLDNPGFYGLCGLVLFAAFTAGALVLSVAAYNEGHWLHCGKYLLVAIGGIALSGGGLYMAFVELSNAARRRQAGNPAAAGSPALCHKCKQPLLSGEGGGCFMCGWKGG